MHTIRGYRRRSIPDFDGPSWCPSAEHSPAAAYRPRRHQQRSQCTVEPSYLPGINSLFIMCLGIIRNNSLVDGRARAESNPSHWVRHALLHMAAECANHSATKAGSLAGYTILEIHLSTTTNTFGQHILNCRKLSHLNNRKLYFNAPDSLWQAFTTTYLNHSVTITFDL